MRYDTDRNTQRIGIVSTRICGTDGVSLEVGKWTDILERMGYECYFTAGEYDRASERQFVIPEADFQHPAVLEINDRCFATLTDDSHRQQMVDHNYEVGRKHFSYDRVENELRSMPATRWQAPYA